MTYNDKKREVITNYVFNEITTGELNDILTQIDNYDLPFHSKLRAMVQFDANSSREYTSVAQLEYDIVADCEKNGTLYDEDGNEVG